MRRNKCFNVGFSFCCVMYNLHQLAKQNTIFENTMSTLTMLLLVWEKMSYLSTFCGQNMVGKFGTNMELWGRTKLTKIIHTPPNEGVEGHVDLEARMGVITVDGEPVPCSTSSQLYGSWYLSMFLLGVNDSDEHSLLNCPEETLWVPVDNRVVYRCRCNHLGCTADYIGETGRTFGDRYREHLKAPSSQ